jgi:isocitrate/isopropylmalate dehydrogenase
MLGWLGERHKDDRLTQAGRSIGRAVEAALADGDRYLTPDLGGAAKTQGVAEGVIRHLA